MPVVTVDPNNYTREELKTAPADPNTPGDEPGYIMVRPLPYGMKLTRRDKATKMAMEVSGNDRRRRGEQTTQKFDLETMSEWANQFDFAYCIGDHNLLDAAGNKLNFANAMSLKLLDPRVGSEIEQILARYNEDETEESLEDFIKRSTTSSQDEESTSKTTT